MFLQMISFKLNPEKMRAAFQKVVRHPQPEDRMGIKGLGLSLLIESFEEPGQLIWLSTWDTLAQAQAYLSSPSYMELMAEVRAYLVRPPEWFRYNVLEDISLNQAA